jgi:hypothetical protein
VTSPRTTVRRDGTVRVWDVYRQQWAEYAAPGLPDAILATLPQRDRDRIASAARARVLRDLAALPAAPPRP